jgi:hypothetical protein
VQTPPLHTSPEAHIVRQAPQFALSTVTSRQVPPQSMSPPPHETAQLPPLQTSPIAHALPQLPQ